jgi:hypothetical protein
MIHDEPVSKSRPYPILFDEASESTAFGRRRYRTEPIVLAGVAERVRKPRGDLEQGKILALSS